MKNTGHTKTLFIQGGKYKWAFHYDHCIECKTCTSKHKGRGLCTKCFDKNRDKNPKRKEIKYNAGNKWHITNKPRKPPEEWKKKGPKPFLSPEDKKKYRRDWYLKYRDAILFLKKGEVRKRKGLPTIEIMGKHIPYIDIQKPISMNGYDEWKSNMQLFDKVKEFLTK